jgi:hypothetical protein
VGPTRGGGGCLTASRTCRVSASRPRAGGWAALSWATAVSAQDADGKKGKQAAGGETVAGPPTRLGRAQGASWAAAQARLKGEEGRREEKKRFFLFYFSCFSSNSSLECMIHKPSQSNNKMHDSAWCIKQKKVLLGFTYTRSQTESRYNFGKDQGLARGKGKRKG